MAQVLHDVGTAGAFLRSRLGSSKRGAEDVLVQLLPGHGRSSGECVELASSEAHHHAGSCRCSSFHALNLRRARSACHGLQSHSRRVLGHIYKKWERTRWPRNTLGASTENACETATVMA